MPKIVEGARVFVLKYFDPEDEPTICDIFVSKEKAVAEKRRRNKTYVSGECFTEEGDFNYDEYDTCDWCYYEILEFELIF